MCSSSSLISEIPKLDYPMSSASDDFYQVREILISEGRTFSEAEMRVLPYKDLLLCAMGNAGKAACSLDLVKKIQRERRRRYWIMSLEDLEQYRAVLEDQGIYQDVARDLLQIKGGTKYGDLSLRQRIYFALCCLSNHWDEPKERIVELNKMLEEADHPGTQKLNIIVTDMIQKAVRRYNRMTDTNPNKHSVLNDSKRAVLSAMSDAEKRVCIQEELLDFSCTKNCFTPEILD